MNTICMIYLSSPTDFAIAFYKHFTSNNDKSVK